jgi:hypothetical protein
VIACVTGRGSNTTLVRSEPAIFDAMAEWHIPSSCLPRTSPAFREIVPRAAEPYRSSSPVAFSSHFPLFQIEPQYAAFGGKLKGETS